MVGYRQRVSRCWRSADLRRMRPHKYCTVRSSVRCRMRAAPRSPVPKSLSPTRKLDNLARRPLSTPASTAFPRCPREATTSQLQMSGFQSFTENGIEVGTGQIVRVNAVLRVGSITQSVEVTANTAELQSDSAEVRNEGAKAAAQNRIESPIILFYRNSPGAYRPQKTEKHQNKSSNQECHAEGLAVLLLKSQVRRSIMHCLIHRPAGHRDL